MPMVTIGVETAQGEGGDSRRIVGQDNFSVRALTGQGRMDPFHYRYPFSFFRSAIDTCWGENPGVVLGWLVFKRMP